MAWALSTQLSQITPAIDCRHGFYWTAASCGLLLVVSLAGVAASQATQAGGSRPGRFVAETGFLIALAFLLAISLQTASTMLLDPCQR
jgi:hypothetical protein